MFGCAPDVLLLRADASVMPTRLPAPLSGRLNEVHLVASAFDPLLDDSIGFARRLRDAGCNVTLQVCHEMPHGFLNLPAKGPALVDAHQVAVSTLRRALLGR